MWEAILDLFDKCINFSGTWFLDSLEANGTNFYLGLKFSAQLLCIWSFVQSFKLTLLLLRWWHGAKNKTSGMLQRLFYMNLFQMIGKNIYPLYSLRTILVASALLSVVKKVIICVSNTSLQSKSIEFHKYALHFSVLWHLAEHHRSLILEVQKNLTLKYFFTIT